MASVHGEEVSRRDSIGSSEANRELQEVSSVQLMRDCILRSISKENLRFYNQRRYGHREEIPNPNQPSIEVKFLEKKCPSFSSPKSQSEETNKEKVKLPEQTSKTGFSDKKESKNQCLPDFEVSGSFEISGELFNKDTDKGEGGQRTKEDKDTVEELINIEGSNDDTSSKLKNSGKNCLKLAIRSKSGGIFEDCSTYNISCPDASPKFKNNETFANSLADSYSDVTFADLENSTETNNSYTNSELTFSSLNDSPDSPDEQTSLCDTFFTHIANNENGQLPEMQSPHLSQVNRRTSTSKQQPKRNSPLTEDGTIKRENVVDQNGRRNSKKIRRRDRKNHSKDPIVYECPKCGVSYVIASKVTNDGVCFHCDMWTSVEPEFMKREKLLTWNNCRIC